MLLDCLRFIGGMVVTLLRLNIPGTPITFMQLAAALAFLPVIINVFARIFGGTLDVIKTQRAFNEYSARHSSQSNLDISFSTDLTVR